MTARKTKTVSFYQTGWFAAAACIGVALALISPLFTVQYTQNIDLINHMARQFVRHAAADSPLRHFYEFKWLLVPYLSIDAFVEIFIGCFSVYDCAKILLGAIVILWTAAPVVLYRALWGRWSVWPLLGSLVIYNASFAWGFAAYMLTAGFAVLVFAAWVATDKKDAGKNWKRTGLFGLLCFLIYCGHLFAFGLFGLMLGAYELSKLAAAGPVTAPKFFRRALELAPLGLAGGVHFIYQLAFYPPLPGTETFALTTGDRLVTLFSPFIYGLDTVNGATRHLVGWWSLLLLGGAIAFFALRRRMVFHKHMPYVLIFTGVAAAIMPSQLFGISYTHYRLPFIVIALLFASMQVEVPKKHTGYALAALFVLALWGNVSHLAQSWKNHDAEVREFIEKTAVIARGKKVLLVNREFPKVAFVEHFHTGSTLVIEREDFIPNLFIGTYVFNPVGDYARLSSYNAAHPLDAAFLQQALDGQGAMPGEKDTGYWKSWWKDFDYVIAYHTAGKPALYPQLLEQVASGTYFTVYKMKPAAKKYRVPK